MLVKICGITNPDDARTAQEAGADFLGLNFIERKSGVRSKRYVPEDNARVILQSLSGQSQAVGLFQNHPVDHVAGLVSRLDLQVVQLHGDETPDYVNDLLSRLPHCRILKAITVTGPESVAQMKVFYRSLQNPQCILAFLLDAPGGGGTGTSFDWTRTADALAKSRTELPPIFLAGGLTPDNVSEAIRIIQPDGVDVSSGVEASPGRKDSRKVCDFVRLAKEEKPHRKNVKSADSR